MALVWLAGDSDLGRFLGGFGGDSKVSWVSEHSL